MPAQLPSEIHRQLVVELASALEKLVQTTCRDMGPLWVAATVQQRRSLAWQPASELGFTPSKRYQRLSDAPKSKYRSFAAWRHAVLWHEVTQQIDDPDFRTAFERMYFTPYPKNAPPYAWSQRATAITKAGDSSGDTKKYAKEGARISLERLGAIRDRYLRGGRQLPADADVRADFLQRATQRSLTDVLKQEDMDDDGDRK